jgi:hypothetical protein
MAGRSPVHVSLIAAADVCRWGMLTSGTSANRGLATRDRCPQYCRPPVRGGWVWNLGGWSGGVGF